MLFLKRLELYGFKTFSYKVNISFSSGITAIVGPNGSGKSNIIDAIKWVLGEQTPRKLRIKELSDIIYSGNSKRILDFTEVTLILNNEPNLFEKFKDFSEITITRRFYRSGESEFYLNQKPCRLKDIQSLLLEVGITPQSYMIIDQGEVTKLLEASPKEKKQLLNDLAGISKIKFTEEEIQKNLKLAEENLEKLELIFREVKSQYDNLKRQAEKAQQYLTLKQRLQQLITEKNLYLLQIAQKEKQTLELKAKNLISKKNELDQGIKEIEKKEENLILHILEINKHLKLQQKELKEKEEKLKEMENILNSLHKKKLELLHEIEKEELKMNHNQEKLQNLLSNEENLVKKIEKIQESLKTLNYEEERLLKQKEILSKDKKNFLTEFKKIENLYINILRDLEVAQERKKIVTKELENLTKEKEILLKELKTLKEKKEKLIEEKKLNENLKTHKQNLLKEYTLKKEKFEKDISEIKEKKDKLTLEKQKVQNELNLIFEKIKLIERMLPQNYKINTKNSFYLFDILLKNYKFEKDDLNILEKFLDEKLKAVLLEDLKSLEKGSPIFFLEHPYFIKRLEIKKFETINKVSLDELIDKFCFVYFKKEGILLSPLGIGISVSEIKKGNISLILEKEELIKKKEALLDKEKEIKNHLSELEKQYEVLSQENIKISKSLQTIQNLIDSLEYKLKNLDLNLVKIEEQETNKKSLILQIENKILNKQTEFKNLLDKIRDLELHLKETEIKYKDSLQEKEVIEKKLKEIEIKLAQNAQKSTQLKKELEVLSRKKKKTSEMLVKISEDIKNFQQSISEKINFRNYIENEINKNQQNKNNLIEFFNKLKFDLQKILQEKENLENTLKFIQQERREKEKIREKLKIEIHNLEIRLTEKKMAIETFKKTLLELGYKLNEKYRFSNFIEIDLNSVEKEIENLKERLENFKEVNLASIKEFEIVSFKFNDLLEQKKDLELSIKKLRDLLEELKKTSRQRIIDTLQKVNEKLKEIFPHLFEGGEARLVFTDDDPLTAGLDLYVKLPGKSVKHLTTLSGGEKALCVIALLIAFYMVNPAPFCILDEIDAHLDEKNSLKFINLLKIIKKNSQIILITHNPLIMKEADTLLGITMEEKGVSKIFKINLKSLLNESKYPKGLTKRTLKLKNSKSLDL